MTTIAPLAMTYVVTFPAEGVVKVGRAWKMSRIRSLMRAGGQIVMLLEHTPVEIERALLTVFKSRFSRAFQTESDARWLLPGGRGFTECFMASERTAVMNAISEGLKNGYDQATHAASRALATVQVGSTGTADPADVDRPAGIGRRPRSRPRRAAPDQGRRVPARRGRDRRCDLGARPEPRRGRVPDALSGRPGDVLPDRSLAQGRPAEPVRYPAASGPARERFRNRSGTVPGSRGRESGRGRAGERAAEGGWRGPDRTRSGIRRGTLTVLHRSPERNPEPLPRLWAGSPPSLPVLAATAATRGLTEAQEA